MGRALKSMAVAIALTYPVHAYADCQLSQIAELKVTMEGLRPFVAAQINGHDEKFLVDSGAFYSSITPGTAKELGLVSIPTNMRVGGVGGSSFASFTRVKSFGIVGSVLNNISFVVSGSETGHAGLLGQNVLGIADVEYDLEHGAVRLMRPRECKNMVPAYWAKGSISELPIDARDARNPHTLGMVSVNGQRFRAMFDTGADTTVMSIAAAKRAGVDFDSAEVKRAGFSRGVGRNIVGTYRVPIDNITIGTEQIKRTHIFASELPPDTDMLIGADFFISHRVYVANSTHKLYFTYDGGPIFNVAPKQVLAADGKASPVPADAEPEPTDADGWSRQGAAMLARPDFPKAIAAFDHAIALAPTQSRYYFQRATARMRAREPLLAMDDLDQTLKLAPDDVDARLMRAGIRAGRHDRSAAEDDVAALDRVLPPASDYRIRLGGLYDALEQPDKAIPQYDLWIRTHPDDNKRPLALNGRCWARAMLGSDLPKALADCDGALHAGPHTAAFLDSRALVYFRMGDYAKALRDYDAALAVAPKQAWSLYCRGLTKQRLGQKAEGASDIAAATALDPAVPVRARKLGLS